ncbi:MAG: SWF/SNF helicase family protein, partial [Patescibacteria group bacterium]|nr:SWF/SNF helicase family protein [Patescibacteria group bacterium]
MTYRSKYPYTPKAAAALQLIADIMERREQVVVFSAFNDPSDRFSDRLREAGVEHRIMDGRSNQAKRASISREFKAWKFPVLLCGIESCAELHSWPQANNVILTSYSWSFDKWEQSINRVHRMTSPKPVNVYSIICEGSIDRKLEASIHEKKDAAELVLDGHLLGETPAEVNLAELLHLAQREFKNVKTLDEHELEQGWPKLRAALSRAYVAWR